MALGLRFWYLANIYFLSTQPCAKNTLVAEHSAKVEAWPCGLCSQWRLQESQVSNSREQVMWRQVSVLSKGLATFLVPKGAKQ